MLFSFKILVITSMKNVVFNFQLILLREIKSKPLKKLKFQVPT